MADSLINVRSIVKKVELRPVGTTKYDGLKLTGF